MVVEFGSEPFLRNMQLHRMEFTSSEVRFGTLLILLRAELSSGICQALHKH